MFGLFKKVPAAKPVKTPRDRSLVKEWMSENHRSTRITEPVRKPADDYFTHVEKKLRRV